MKHQFSAPKTTLSIGFRPGSSAKYVTVRSNERRNRNEQRIEKAGKEALQFLGDQNLPQAPDWVKELPAGEALYEHAHRASLTQEQAHDLAQKEKKENDVFNALRKALETVRSGEP